jgi:diacylglycerol kinase family enzyme
MNEPRPAELRPSQLPRAVIRVHAFINPHAGPGSPDPEAVLTSVAEAFHKIGIEATVEAMPKDAGSVVERAIARGKQGEIDAIVVGGGDGTVSAAAAAMAGSGVPLGILPLGTLNHFAKDLEIPVDLDKAVAVIKAGAIRMVDLGEVNGRLFVNNSSIGFYPSVVVTRDLLRKTRGMSKWPAMWLATFRALRTLSQRRLKVRVEGTTKVVRTPCLFIGNNEYGTQVFELGRRARLDGGELWLYVVRPVGPFGLARLAVRMALGLLNTERDLIVFKGRSAVIETRPQRTLVALDGEVVSADAPLRYLLRPKALTVFAPEPLPQ